MVHNLKMPHFHVAMRYSCLLLGEPARPVPNFRSVADHLLRELEIRGVDVDVRSSACAPNHTRRYPQLLWSTLADAAEPLEPDRSMPWGPTGSRPDQPRIARTVSHS